MNGIPEPQIPQKSAPPVRVGSGVKRDPLTYERARELFDYDPCTGIVTRRKDLIGGRGCLMVPAGTIVGSLNRCSGYLEVGVDYNSTLLHRLIWVWWYGYLPEKDIDHIDRDKTNNRLSNLREVSRACNMINTNLGRNNSSGVKGVSKTQSGSWHCYITVAKRRYSFGNYKDFIECVAMRLSIEECLGWVSCDCESTAKQVMKEYLTGGRE